MTNIINKYRFLILIVCIILAILSVTQFSKLRINEGFTEYIPKDVGNRAHLQVLDSIFGGSEKIMLILTDEKDIINTATFERIQRLTTNLNDLGGIERCQSLIDVIDISLEDGFTTIEPIINEIPSDSTELEALKQKILNSKMGQRFVSEDLSATAIILTKSDTIQDKEIIASIKNLIAENPGKEQVFIGGLSYIRNSIKSYIKRDLFTLLPAALLLMVLMLYLSFREWKGVLLPFTVVILSIIFSFGLMAVLGWKISIISLLLPIMMIAIANDYSIHLINLYQEKLSAGQITSMKEVAISIYRELRKPVLLTALTTIGGMLGLLSHKMPPAAQLGVLASVGIGLALIMSLVLVPVLLSFYKWPGRKRSAKSQKVAILDKILQLSSDWIIYHPKRILAGFFLATVISIAGFLYLKVDTDVESYFLGNSDIRQGIDMVNHKFGGSQYVSILFRGNILDPAILKRMDQYTNEIEKISQVGHVISPSLFFKELSKGVYTPDEKAYMVLPGSEAEAEQYLEIFSMSGDEDQVSQLIDYNYENARILVSMKDGSNQTMKSILKGLTNITKDDPNLVCIAGPGLSKIQIADMVINGQISSLILAFVIIFLLLSYIFKSLIAGLKGILPLILSVIFLFGIMGYMGISLDIVTTLLSSVMIGVGVDYTIHFLWKYKEEFQKTNNKNIAIRTTLLTTGRGIVFNAFSVIVGFSALIFSNFAPLRFFGILVVVSIFSCLICALLLVPALISAYGAHYAKVPVKWSFEKQVKLRSYLPAFIFNRTKTKK